MIGVGLYSCSAVVSPPASPSPNSVCPGRASPLLRLRHRRDQLRAPTSLFDMVGRLPLGVEFPMPAGVSIGRIEDRPLEKALDHALFPRFGGLLSGAFAISGGTATISEGPGRPRRLGLPERGSTSSP